ncbi:gamma carbonic anhydrase family protein [Saprospiraceae bacterium]|nr:gamma carbonic anhydrase family protein [Saprospiraceae bacterium]
MNKSIVPLRGFTPEIGENCFIADTSRVIGDVKMGDDCSIWYGAVLRGDVNSIRLGDRVNVQDGAIIHCTYEKSKSLIGDDVSIGHGAVIHGCIIEKEVLIGMKAVVMDNTVIPSHVIIAAGAVVLENQRLESGWIYAGVPAKKLKKLEADNLEFFIKRTAKNYIKYSSWYK